MRKYRFVLKNNPSETSLIDDLEQVFQIRKVLRLALGDYIEGLWQNTVFRLKIICLENKQIKFEIIDEISQVNHLKTKINLLLPILKNPDKTELILQKGTELGVHEFQFIDFEYSVKQNYNSRKTKYKRWQKIIEEAVEQSERNSIPTLHENILALKDFKNTKPNCLLLAFIERIDFKLLIIKEKINELPLKQLDYIQVIFGPEGGFSPSEKDILKQNGFQAYSLGNSILRSETAIISGLSLINYQLNEVTI